MSQHVALSQAAAAGAGAAMALESGGGRKRKRARSAKTVAIARGGVSSRGFAFPERYKTVLRYYDVFTLASAAYSGTYVFNANSLFDPDRTGTGHQPRGFDQLAGANVPYNRYLVTKVNWRFVPMSGIDGLFSVNNQNSSTGLLLSSAAEQRSCTVRPISIIQAGNVPATIKFTTDCAKEAGVTLAQLRAEPDRFGAVYSSSPSEIQCVNLAYVSYDSSTVATVYCHVMAEFHCEFFDINLLPAS